MKKAPKIEYGIEIVKPWSPAMYAHNEEVAFAVRESLMTIFNRFADSLVPGEESERGDALQNFGTRVVGYGGWVGFSNARILQEIELEINTAPFYRLREIAEELGLKLEKGFVGF